MSRSTINVTPDIDIVLGAQYGDEGKGMVAKLMADRAELEGNPYEWTARVGAQNAEHRFIHQACDFCARILPSASCYRPNIKAILGAGHCFRPEQLPLEATHLGVPLERIYVDAHAMWLHGEHAVANLEIGNARGTTGWGVGAAIAEKVRRKPGTQLIGDNEVLRGLLGSRITSVPIMLNSLGSGLFEGSQGAMLSLDHGHYPYCTAKNVTVPAMLGELGVGVKRLRRTIGVSRMVVMRVSGPSGPTAGKEVSYDDIEQRCNLRLPHHRRLQGDTSRWKASTRDNQAEEERLFELSVDEMLLSHTLNNYDALVLTFADYHRKGNYRVTDFNSLHPDTQSLVRDLDRNIAPVILVRTGPGEHDNIWRI